jgi:hypothetical protein
VLTSVTVRGFRGIGPSRTAEFPPGPGLTVVTGRNGSGKSSFAEAIEVALTGANRRWLGDDGKPAHPLQQHGWRNLHHPQDPRIDLNVLVPGRSSPVTITRTWPGEPFTDSQAVATGLSGPGPVPASALGWDEALRTYRPILSYSELGQRTRPAARGGGVPGHRLVQPGFPYGSRRQRPVGQGRPDRAGGEGAEAAVPPAERLSTVDALLATGTGAGGSTASGPAEASAVAGAAASARTVHTRAAAFLLRRALDDRLNAYLQAQRFCAAPPAPRPHGWPSTPAPPSRDATPSSGTASASYAATTARSFLRRPRNCVDGGTTWQRSCGSCRIRRRICRDNHWCSLFEKKHDPSKGGPNPKRCRHMSATFNFEPRRLATRSGRTPDPRGPEFR